MSQQNPSCVLPWNRFCLALVTNPHFDRMFGITLIALIVLLSLHASNPLPGYTIAINTISSFCAVEWVLRVSAFGKKCFKSTLFLMESLSIFLAMLDIVVFSHIESLRFLELKYALVFRIYRLSRVLVLLKRSQQLRFLTASFLRSARVAPQFVMVLIPVMVPFAILLTRFVGRGQLFDGATTDEGTLNYTLWGNFARSMLSLFQIGTMDWGDIARSSIERAWWLSLFYVCYVILVGMALAALFLELVALELEELMQAWQQKNSRHSAVNIDEFDGHKQDLIMQRLTELEQKLDVVLHHLQQTHPQHPKLTAGTRSQCEEHSK